MKREDLRAGPVHDMIGGGTYDMPPGTWSDDSSLTFCLAEALAGGFDLKVIGQNFVRWYKEGWWTAGGNVFDVGGTTRRAIERLIQDPDPLRSGDTDEGSNGNGSLMRIAPLVLYLEEKPVEERFQIVKQVSGITHGHIRSVIACFYWLEFARKILVETWDRQKIYSDLQKEIPEFLATLSIDPSEIAHFDRLLKGDISKLPEDQIRSDGYLVHTLEASIWSFLTTDNFKDAVLKAVNLGDDTDTTGAVTGGLAGLYYGDYIIPERWIAKLARRKDIEELAERMGKRLREEERERWRERGKE
jgi:ADP-ribosylglycohydrolase